MVSLFARSLDWVFNIGAILTLIASEVIVNIKFPAFGMN